MFDFLEWDKFISCSDGSDAFVIEYFDFPDVMFLRIEGHCSMS